VDYPGAGDERLWIRPAKAYGYRGGKSDTGEVHRPRAKWRLGRLVIGPEKGCELYRGQSRVKPDSG